MLCSFIFPKNHIILSFIDNIPLLYKYSLGNSCPFKTTHIDKNATDPVRNPVENIIFQKAEDGDYIIQLKLFESRNVKDIPFKVEFVIFGDVFYYKGVLSEAKQGKNLIEIVDFTCRDGKYRINSYINEPPPKKLIEDGLDLLTQ